MSVASVSQPCAIPCLLNRVFTQHAGKAAVGPTSFQCATQLACVRNALLHGLVGTPHVIWREQLLPARAAGAQPRGGVLLVLRVLRGCCSHVVKAA